MSSSSPPALVWFRDDLRLADNPALHAAAASGRPLVCLFVQDEVDQGVRPPGGAARWWLDGSLAALDDALAALGGRLCIARGPAAETVETWARKSEAGAVYWNRRYDEAGRTIDTGLKSILKAGGITAESFNGHLLNEPWTVMNRSGAPFQVFAAYWKAACRSGEPPAPLQAPRSLSFHPLPHALETGCLSLADLGLRPRSPDWAGGLRETWTCGERAGRDHLHRFLDEGLAGYSGDRDRPDKAETSRLSPYLRFGNISVREVWHTANDALQTGASRAGRSDLEKFLSELGWREFAYHTLFHMPDLGRANQQLQFDAMPWRDDKAALKAWQRGQTGYPIVDAGMRELWATGWMHNRVRMVAASFLTKHLMIDWREGEAWFWDTLVDADPANNPFNWQWVAGSGVDAAPYFRIFNPTLQGETFDPNGDYVRRWVPELADFPASEIHRPWRSKAGHDRYPPPIVDHDAARKRALAIWQSLRPQAATPR